MRPRRFRRGNPDALGTHVTCHARASMRPRRFRRGNPSRERMALDDRSASMRPRRFRRGNPAGATIQDTEEPASMRPRRFRRGNRGYHSRRGRRQCCRFNEAPAIPPGKPSRLAGRKLEFDHASMRPRRFRRGNRGECPTDRLDRVASMRPRRFRRGNRSRHTSTSRAGSGLQ